MTQFRNHAANLFHVGLDGGSSPGTLSVQPGHLEFKWGDGTLKFPLVGLRVRLDGHDGRQIFFEHGEFPEWSIHTAEKSILDELAAVADPVLRAAIRSLHKKIRGIPASFIFLGLFVLLLGAVVAALFWKRDVLVRKAAEKVPVEWERKLGDIAFDQIKLQVKIVNDPARMGKVRSIADRLLPAVKDAGYEFQFHIAENTNINAFVMPGGHVVIFTGLIDAARSQEEIAGVIAHELAHVTRRHSVRNIIGSAGVAILIQSVIGDLSGLQAVILQGGQSMLDQKFSRDFEREADDVGWNYLMAADIDPRGLIDFFKKLREDEARRDPAGLGNALALLNTHPATQERIDRLQAKWQTQIRKDGFRSISRPK
ncbi:MAG: M48 family metallopeptidase [Opitutaceae bacterium]|nr:M48 family metallopeptidase [Verrucomicrobiales bacterium]